VADRVAEEKVFIWALCALCFAGVLKEDPYLYDAARISVELDAEAVLREED
jgi:hypothetical protein